MQTQSPLLRMLGYSTPTNGPANQLGGPLGGSMTPDMVVQLQQLLLSVLAPMLQSMLQGGGMPTGDGYGSVTGAPGYPGATGGYPGAAGYPDATGGLLGGPSSAGITPGQSFGGVNGFFRDLANGLTQGALAPQGATPGYGDAYGGVQGAYPPATSGPNGGYGGTGGYGDTGVPPATTNDPIPNGLDYRDLSTEQRRAISGMSDRERAVLHLWGIQMTSEGRQDGGVLLNVLQNPENFQPAEVELARELQARDQATYGGVTGKSLDQEFFGLYRDITGNDISGRYGNAPIQFADGPINMDNRLSGNNGLTGFENQVLQLWGHAPLFNQGQIDGNIVDYALNSSNALEANLNRSDLLALREADLASDGVLNGDSLENAFIDTLDRLYLGAPGASVDKTMNDALQEAALRRQGLLPPPEPGSYGQGPYGPGAVEGVQPEQGPQMGGGSCPFLAGANAA